MTHCANLIMLNMLSHLTKICQTDISEDDLTYVDVVKVGLLQENRSKKNICVAINGGDFEDPTYLDGIVSLGDFKNIGFDVPPREIGGGELWWRRFVIRIDAFFVKERLEESEAYQAAYELLGRVQNNLQNVDLSNAEDSYGEYAIKLFSYANTFTHSGGAKNSSIFRGKVFCACLTERP